MLVPEEATVWFWVALPSDVTPLTARKLPCPVSMVLSRCSYAQRRLKRVRRSLLKSCFSVALTLPPSASLPADPRKIVPLLVAGSLVVVRNPLSLICENPMLRRSYPRLPSMLNQFTGAYCTLSPPMKRLVTSSRLVFSSDQRGFSFCEPPPWRLGRMYSRPRVSRCSTLTMAGTRVRRKNAWPPPSWFRPSWVLRLYEVRSAMFHCEPI